MPEIRLAWIAEVDAVPVGYLLACFVFSLEHGGLTATHRGSGLGRRPLAATGPKASRGPSARCA